MKRLLTSMAGTALIGAGATAIVVLGAGGATAQLLGGHNSNAPVNFSADRIEVQDRADRVVVSGNVHVTQADLTLDSQRMTVAYRNQDGVQIDRIDAMGNVRVRRGGDTATSNAAVYDLNRKIITLLGDVRLNQGSNTLTGQRLVMNLNDRQTVVSPGQGGRVTGTFTVPQRQE